MAGAQAKRRPLSVIGSTGGHAPAPSAVAGRSRSPAGFSTRRLASRRQRVDRRVEPAQDGCEVDTREG